MITCPRPKRNSVRPHSLQNGLSALHDPAAPRPPRDRATVTRFPPSTSRKTGVWSCVCLVIVSTLPLLDHASFGDSQSGPDRSHRLRIAGVAASQRTTPSGLEISRSFPSGEYEIGHQALNGCDNSSYHMWAPVQASLRLSSSARYNLHLFPLLVAPQLYAPYDHTTIRHHCQPLAIREERHASDMNARFTDGEVLFAAGCQVPK